MFAFPSVRALHWVNIRYDVKPQSFFIFNLNPLQQLVNAIHSTLMNLWKACSCVIRLCFFLLRFLKIDFLFSTLTIFSINTETLNWVTVLSFISFSREATTNLQSQEKNHFCADNFIAYSINVVWKSRFHYRKLFCKYQTLHSGIKE